MWLKQFIHAKVHNTEASVTGVHHGGDREGVVEDDVVRDLMGPDLVGLYGSLLGLFLMLSMSWHISRNLSRKQRTH